MNMNLDLGTLWRKIKERMSSGGFRVGVDPKTDWRLALAEVVVCALLIVGFTVLHFLTVEAAEQNAPPAAPPAAPLSYEQVNRVIGYYQGLQSGLSAATTHPNAPVDPSQ